MMEVTKTLYQGGDERFPNVLEYMKQSQPWDMFKRDENIRVNLNASQTHAASWGDGAGDYIHCTGVIYTPTPIVLTIMMKNISDLDILGGVAGHIAVMATELDARQQQLNSLAEKHTASALEDMREDNEENSEGTPLDSDDNTEAENVEVSNDSAVSQPVDSPMIAEREDNAAEEGTASQTLRLWLIVVSALIFLSLIAIAVSLRIRKKQMHYR